MSLLNQVGDYSLAQILARRLTTPDPNPSPTIEPALFPTLTLESDRPEWAFLGGTRRCAGFVNRAADAANFSACAFNNPAGSRTLAVFTLWHISTSTSYSIFRAGTQAGTLGFTGPTDFRWAHPAQQSSVIIPNSQVLAAVPAITELLRFDAPIAGPKQLWEDISFVAAPGTTILIVNRAINAGLSVSAQWYERATQPSELG